MTSSVDSVDSVPPQGEVMSLEADLQPVDHQRGYRLLIAVVDGDLLAFHTVLDEAMADPGGVPGLMFFLAQFAGSLGVRLADDFAAQLQEALLAAAQDDPT